MDTNAEIIAVEASNVTQYGFFCYKSEPKSEGYRRKLAWLRERFAEGMRIKIVYEGKRSVGFVEYIPDGTWPLDQTPPHPPLDFGRPGEPNKWLTLDALRVTKLLHD